MIDPISDRYHRLINVSLDLASTLELNTLLKRINALALDLTDAEASSILFYDDRKNELYFAVADNPTTETLLSKITVPLESIAGWVVRNRIPVFVPNVQQDDRHFVNVQNLLQFKTRSIMATPMLVKGKLIGVLEAINKKTGTFTPTDLETLEFLSAQAAVAIENSRLFQQADLISELVHEIRTPLTSINTITSLLQHPELEAVQRQQFCEMIQREISAAERTCQHLSRFFAPGIGPHDFSCGLRICQRAD